jgi:hypothetical protein
MMKEGKSSHLMTMSEIASVAAKVKRSIAGLGSFDLGKWLWRRALIARMTGLLGNVTWPRNKSRL